MCARELRLKFVSLASRNLTSLYHYICKTDIF